ncbi:site-specific DNA-methyltransferase [Azospirillum sp. A1-3]|uniref:DNA-methyltransferase n=1 Tax=Azospirillum sp. A1-3 TaxID=185874 RepID=UPI002076F52A|nr:site-specific DNA-methyltransferase [Azospirillum sp. A1-3]MCM8738264.1 site-specific DNA-methyltransferase [Azospirillum sp. A1-3]
MDDPVKPRTLDLFEQGDTSVAPVGCKAPTQCIPAFEVEKFMEGAEAPYFQSPYGALFDGDCMDFLPRVKSATIDTVFADPPFNLDKKYGKKSNDKLPDAEYVSWCRSWLNECMRILKPGGALFVYNLPRWNILLGAYLMEQGMVFRHDITVEIKSSLPIAGRLYPAHYSLLYFTKGKPKTFRKIRTPIEVCRHCGGEIKDYGGHRHAMNPLGVNLKDVWTDIPPVRHWKFKSKDRPANALSTKLLDRVVEMSTVEGEVVLDPFGGSGTTFAVCEKKNRYWLGSELDFSQQIKERLLDREIAHHSNSDHIED